MSRLVPGLADLLQDAQRISEMPLEAIAAVLGDLERLKAILWRWLLSAQVRNEEDQRGKHG